MSEIITCPSGLTGRIRAMLVRKERIRPTERRLRGLLAGESPLGCLVTRNPKHRVRKIPSENLLVRPEETGIRSFQEKSFLFSRQK